MKKGFTLVELLAVIVVLAILSLVAIPIVSNVIDKGKEGAIENSVSFYIKEVESKFSEWMVEGYPEGVIFTNSGNNIVFNVENLNTVLKLEGSLPIAGNIEINNDYSVNGNYFGYVVNATLEYEDGKIANYIYHVDDNYEGNRSEVIIIKK